MSMFDKATEMTLALPTGSTVLTYSDAFDLKAGGDGDVPRMLGEDIYLQCQVTVAAAEAAGSPLIQIGAAVGDTDPLDGGALCIGMAGGASDGVGGPFVVQHGELALGAVFYIPLQPWSAVLTAIGSGDIDSYRYLGIFAQNIAGTPDSNDLSAGTIKARVVHRAGNNDHLQSLVPSRMQVL